MKPQPLSKEKVEQLVNQWNAQHAPGVAVELTDDKGVVVRTRTRSAARVMNGHAAVVWVEGHSGGCLLEQVKPVTEEKKP